MTETKKVILIAEDDITSRIILEKVPEKSGYDVVSTVNGKEAFERLSNCHLCTRNCVNLFIATRSWQNTQTNDRTLVTSNHLHDIAKFHVEL